MIQLINMLGIEKVETVATTKLVSNISKQIDKSITEQILELQNYT